MCPRAVVLETDSRGRAEPEDSVLRVRWRAAVGCPRGLKERWFEFSGALLGAALASRVPESSAGVGCPLGLKEWWFEDSGALLGTALASGVPEHSRY